MLSGLADNWLIYCFVGGLITISGKILYFFQMYLNWGSSNQNDLLKLIIQGRILNEKRFSDQEHVFFTEFVSGRKMAIVSCLCLMVARCSLTVKTFLYEENLDNVERS